MLATYSITITLLSGHTEIDHVEPWANGGLTTEDNGRAACAFHNRARHRPPEPP